MFLNIMDHVSAIVPEWAANILPRDLLFRFSLDCLRASGDPTGQSPPRGSIFPVGRAVFWTALVLFSGRLANILLRVLLFLVLWTVSALPGIRLSNLRLAALVSPPAGRFLGLPVVFFPVG